MSNAKDPFCCCSCSQETLYDVLKYLLITYNFFFLLLGFSLIGLGVYSEIMRSELTEADHVFVTPSVFLFILGAVVSIFACIGFVASLRDNFCLLRTFNICIVVCILIEVGAGIAALIFKDPAKEFVNRYILKGLVTYYDDQDLKNLVDFIQEEFQCCGGRLYKDWEKNPYHNCTAPGPAACGVPYSCCKPDNSTVINSMCGYNTLQLTTEEAVEVIYLIGCIDAVLDFLWVNLDLLAGLLLGIFLPQMAGIFLGVFYLQVLEKIVSNFPAAPENESFMHEEARQYGFQQQEPYTVQSL
ncbi:tetraspanin-15-like [Clavelina lepadiformis]|uniref:Tetraspanin n=1 Tax=Clavelina lepadiformis TaxID=159417 RepID=A0ABP0F4Y0_CLALP